MPSAVLRAGAHTEADASALAAHLARMGVNAGDRVLLLSDNCADYPLALLALCHLDVSIVLGDAQMTAVQVRDVMRVTAVRWLLDGRTAEPPRGRGSPAVLDLRGWRTLAGDGGTGRVSLQRWEQRQDAVLMWSSGTTGEPKAIVKSGSAVLENCRTCARAMGYRRDDVLAPLLPFSHQYGMSVLLIWWLTGCGLLVAPYHRLDRALAATSAAGATVVDSAPPLYDGLLSLLSRRPALLDDLRAVRMWCVGGAPLPKPLAERFRALTGHDLLDGYGMTEMGNIALATCERPVGCGPPLPGVELRILGDGGSVLPPGTVGEIVVRTPGRMEGYLQGDARLTSPEPWFRTRDLGYLDAFGNLHVRGRRNAVHRMGHTLYPEDLERRAEECGAPVKVIALDDDRRGAALVFFVQDAQGDTPAWRRRLRDHLAPFERPNDVVVVAEFPRNRNGKVDTAALRRKLPR